jgi:hypothetical protein
MSNYPVYFFVALFCKLMIAHFLCDYPWQGDFLAKSKSHRRGFSDIPFYHGLVAHASIHGGAVWLLTDSIVLGAAEMICHAVIDYLKCDDRIDFAMDQSLHTACKLGWLLLV